MHPGNRGGFIIIGTDIPDCFPSNPQAEIFMGGTVKPKYIKAVVVESLPEAEKLYSRLMLPADWNKSMIGYSKSYFRPRCDYTYWQQDKKTGSDFFSEEL